jgi:transcription-repair coupling factor (superfamily II helicase)
MTPRGTPVPPFLMDRPVLHAFVRQLADDGRLAELAEALPTRARVSEAALPVVLASLHERLGRPLVCLLAEDADARDAAEAAAWFLGDDVVGYLPGRGVRWDSGLEPPPHLVGERARALAVLERGGLICASAHAVSEALPPQAARPRPIELTSGEEVGV